MMEYVLTALLTVSLGANIFLVVSLTKLRELVQTGLDLAAKARTTRVRLPIPDVLALGFQPRNGMQFSEDAGVFRDPSEFRRKPGPHPATLSPAQRRNL